MTQRIWQLGSDCPAVLDVQQVEKYLGFNHREIKALLKSGHLRPLGKNRKRTQKRFAAASILALMEDIEWLSTARDIICAHWRRMNAGKRKNRATQTGSSQSTGLQKFRLSIRGDQQSF